MTDYISPAPRAQRAPRRPTYGKWRPWFNAMLATYGVSFLASCIPTPVTVGLSVLGFWVGSWLLWKTCRVASAEGRDKRGRREFRETGQRPYGVVPPVMPARAHRRPRFWVAVGFAVQAVIAGIGFGALAATAREVPHPDYDYGTITTYDTTLAVGISIITAITFAAFAGMALACHLRITEAVEAPTEWWDAAETADDDYGYEDDADYDADYDAESPVPDVPDGVSADDVYSRLRNLPPEEMQRFADLLDHDEDADEPKPGTRTQSRGPVGGADLDAMFPDE